MVNLKEKTLESFKDRLLFYYLSFEPDPFTICEETSRPKFILDGGQTFYDKLLKTLSGFKVIGNSINPYPILSIENIEHSEMLSMCKIFISFVIEHKKFPSLVEYKQFLMKNKQSYHATNGEKKICIFPTVIIRDLKKIHDYYEPIARKVSIADFIERARKSFFVKDKVEMEMSFIY